MQISFAPDLLPAGIRQSISDRYESKSSIPISLPSHAMPPAPIGAIVLGWVAPPEDGQPVRCHDSIRLTMSTGPGGRLMPTAWRWSGASPQTSRLQCTAAKINEVFSARPARMRAIELGSSHPLQPLQPDGRKVFPMWANPSTGLLSLWPDEYNSAMPIMAEKLQSLLRGANPAIFLIDDEWRGDVIEICRQDSQYGPNAISSIVADSRFESLLDAAGITRNEFDWMVANWRNRAAYYANQATHRWISLQQRRHVAWLSTVEQLLNAAAGNNPDAVTVPLANLAHSRQCPAVFASHADYDPFAPQFGSGVSLPPAGSGDKYANYQCVKLYGMIPDRLADGSQVPKTNWGSAYCDALRLTASLRTSSNPLVNVLQCNLKSPASSSQGYTKSAIGFRMKQIAAATGLVVVSQEWWPGGVGQPMEDWKANCLAEQRSLEEAIIEVEEMMVGGGWTVNAPLNPPTFNSDIEFETSICTFIVSRPADEPKLDIPPDPLKQQAQQIADLQAELSNRIAEYASLSAYSKSTLAQLDSAIVERDRAISERDAASGKLQETKSDLQAVEGRLEKAIPMVHAAEALVVAAERMANAMNELNVVTAAYHEAGPENSA